MSPADSDTTTTRATQLTVWALCATLTAATVALLLALAPIDAPAGRLQLPWWLLVAAFAVTELGVVHIHVRRSAHSLTLAEIPLVLGLMFAAPTHVIAAWTIGAGAVLLIQRELPAIRIVFNIALFGVTAGVAAAAFHALAGHAGQTSPAEWAAATTAATASAVIASGVVAAAMILSREAPGTARMRSMLVTALAIATVNAALGLAVAVVLIADPRAAVLLLAPAVALFVAYRAYTAERNRTTSLEFLYAAGRALSRASQTTAGLAGMLAMARQTFRAELAQVWTFASPDTPGGRVVVNGDGHVEIDDDFDPAIADALHSLLDGQPARRIQTAALDGVLGATLRDAGVHSAMLASLPGERSAVGAMLIADRLGVGGDFSSEELRLFETLAHHTGATLGQDRLGRKVSRLHEIQQDLEHQAFHDPLTGLANRLLFMDRVAYALTRRTGNAVVLYIDLDDFKPVNDTLGHDAGDELLREVGTRLRRALRPADTPARLGGDEFAVLLIDISEQHARLVADRILNALAEPYNLTRNTAQISASMGLALAASGTLNADELVRNADTAMYVCKHDGKHGLTVHDHPQQAEPLSVTGIDAASRKHSASDVPTSAHDRCDVTQAARASDEPARKERP